MTEKKRRGRPRKQPTDVEDFLTLNDRYDTPASKAAKGYVMENGRKVAVGKKAGNNATTGND